MVRIFRQEMRKIKYVLWIVFLGFALPTVMRNGMKSRHEAVVARVNGQPVTLAEFQRTQNEIQQQYQMLAMYFGIPYNHKASDKEIIRRCASDKLTDNLITSLNIQLDPGYLQDELARRLNYFIDETGRINMERYQEYLNRINMKAAEFEQQQEESIKRNVISEIVRNAYYAPSYVVCDRLVQEHSKKQFSVLKFPLEKFLATTSLSSLSNEEKAKYYRVHEEEYRTAERRKASYVVLSPTHHAASVGLDEEAVESYYAKNKEQFKTPSRIKIRRLLFKSDMPLEEAQAIYAEIKEKPGSFADHVKKYSADKATAGKGCLTDYIEKGTLDPAVERAAFKLREKGELTQVVRSKEGLEIVQLEERTASVEKPLSSVRSEIVKVLTNRKSVQQLKSKVDAVVRSAKHDNPAQLFAAFTEENKAKVLDSGLLSTADGKSGGSLANELATKLFGKHDKLGSFMHKNDYVVYLVTAVEKSAIPPYEAVADKVAKDCQKSKAIIAQKSAAAEARQELIGGKKTLEELSKELGLSLVSTGLIKAKDEVGLFKDSGDLLTKAFELSDTAHVLKHHHNDSYYLVKLTQQEHSGTSKELQKEKSVGIEQEYGRNGYFDSFIASLLRTATIESEKSIETSTPNE